MSINVRWYDERQTILRVEYAGNWSAKDMLAVIDAMTAHIHTVAHYVHSIHDLTRSTARLATISTMLKHRRKSLPARSGMMVFAGSPTTTHLMSAIWRDLDKRLQYYTAESVEAAYALILKHQ